MGLFEKLKNGLTDEEFDTLPTEEFVDRINDVYNNGDEAEKAAIDITWKELTGKKWKPY